MSSIVQFENIYNIQSHKIQENEENIIEASSIKLMLLGKETVGKTSFKSCLLEGKIPEDHLQTFIDAYYFDLRDQSGKETVEYVRIQDSAGQEEYQSIIEQMIFYNDGFFIVYSIDDSDSFQQIQNQIWKKILISKQDQKFFAVLIGNKKDLEESRKVSFLEGQNLANKFGIPFHEISLKNDPKSAKVIFNQLILSMKKDEYQYPQYIQQQNLESNTSNISSISQTRSKKNSIHSIDHKFQKQIISNDNQNNKNQEIQKEKNCCCSIF